MTDSSFSLHNVALHIETGLPELTEGFPGQIVPPLGMIVRFIHVAITDGPRLEGEVFHFFCDQIHQFIRHHQDVYTVGAVACEIDPPSLTISYHTMHETNELLHALEIFLSNGLQVSNVDMYESDATIRTMYLRRYIPDHQYRVDLGITVDFSFLTPHGTFLEVEAKKKLRAAKLNFEEEYAGLDIYLQVSFQASRRAFTVRVYGSDFSWEWIAQIQEDLEMLAREYLNTTVICLDDLEVDLDSWN